MNDVILFLTSQPTESRKQMALTNLRQLKKLNKDIVILSTTPIVDQEFHDIAKYIIIDENKNIVSKSIYKKLMGYSQPAYTAKSVFHYSMKNPLGLNIVVYQQTNYINVYKNTKNLINFAVALGYDNFFYVEDDHYFSDEGLQRIERYLQDMQSLNAIYFSNKWHHDIIRSHFWFGNCRYFSESILNKFPESIEEADGNYPYFSYYELFLHTQMYFNTHNKDKVVFESFDDKPFESLFGVNSILNQHCTEDNIDSDVHCNIVYNFKTDKPTFLFFQKPTKKMHVVVYKDEKILIDRILDTSKKEYIIESISIDGKIKVEVDDKIIKTFNVTLDDVLLNGYIN